MARIAAEMVGCAESGPRPGEEASGSVARPGLTSGWGGEVGEGFGGAAAWGSQSPDRDAVVLPAIALMRSYGWNLDLDSLVVLVI